MMRSWIHGEYAQDNLFPSLSSTEFWTTMESYAPQLSKLAIFVLSIAVQTATCERLFSQFGQIHTKRRNRLKSSKTHYLAQVRQNVVDQEEAAEKVSHASRCRILHPDEIPRKRNNPEEEKQDSNEPEVVTIDDDSDDDDASANDVLPGVSDVDAVSCWEQTLAAFDREDIDEADVLCEGDFSFEAVEKSSYDDGALFRQRNPFPEDAAKYGAFFPQEKLGGNRALKFDLKHFIEGEDTMKAYGIKWE